MFTENDGTTTLSVADDNVVAGHACNNATQQIYGDKSVEDKMRTQENVA